MDGSNIETGAEAIGRSVLEAASIACSTNGMTEC
jgi:hypothetical protein